ncbi:hypothetical protein LCGC14_0615500 [marine sediment metagenome]|uniref:Serpin domain-containing protein n=1 Tax=marine sediment metagenome TaxID=412755 RepID=A0A0F9RQL2_9ZZZZ|nr:serpin family protein [Phycisphaerae bacterium]HDZ42560.1 serpin family protein [Phycisphaerae bacterium]
MGMGHRNRRRSLSGLWPVLLAVVAMWGAGCGPRLQPTKDGQAAENTAPVSRSDAASPTIELPEVGDEPIETLAEASNAFALRLYASLLRNGRESNVIVSPTGLFFGLMMAREGAGGRTREQFDAVLQLTRLTDMADRDLPGECSELLGKLRVVGDTAPLEVGEATELNVANSLWGQQGLDWKDAFLKTLEHDFDGPLNEVNFAEAPAAARAINRWVAERTRGRIGDVISADRLGPGTDMVLAYAVYLTASWKGPFVRTEAERFHVSEDETITVNMMRQKRQLRMARVEKLKLLRQQCWGGISAVFILPDTIEGLADAEAWLISGKLNDGLKASQTREVDVHLPKLDLESTFRLQDHLKAMGLVDAFDPGLADFSHAVGRRGDTWMDMVSQVARVKIEEKGLEGVTAGVLDFLHGPVDMGQFRADHPYLFVIRHDESGLILFIGRVVRPNEVEEQSP